MSLGSALSIAQSGLNAASRQADVASRNIANALTEGYSRREVTLATRSTGGVMVTGTTRFVDQAILADRRMAQAEAAGSAARAAFHDDLETAIGAPQDTGSLGALVAGFDAAVIAAASQPQSDTALVTVVTAAATLAQRINALGDRVQASRLQADNAIATSVDQINTALKQVEGLNTRIATLTGAGQDTGDLQDQRQTLIDTIAEQVPVKEMARTDGSVALMTAGGALLLDGKAATLGFTPVNTMTPDMTFEGGALSGLTLNGRPLAADALGDGELSARFQIRDTLGPAAQADIHGVAQDLVGRLAGTGLIRNGPAGLETDPALEAEPWRVRDGLNAVSQGDRGDATRLNALVSAMSSGRGAQAVAGDLLSSVSTARLAAENATSFATARHDTLRTAELANGVDTDAEMANLLVIQQAYSANAKVIQAVDDMMNTILGI